jgi:hypothetical protein
MQGKRNKITRYYEVSRYKHEKNTRGKFEARKYWHTRISMRDKNTGQEQEVSRTPWSYHDSESRMMDKMRWKSNSKQVRMDQASSANCAFTYQ